MNFMERCLAGEIKPEQYQLEAIKEYDRWDSIDGISGSGKNAAQFLGMTGKEFHLWQEHSEFLDMIVKARRLKT